MEALIDVAIEEREIVKKRNLEKKCIEMLKLDIMKSSGRDLDFEHAEFFWKIHGMALIYSQSEGAVLLIRSMR